MPKCPNKECKKEITQLEEHQKHWVSCLVGLDKYNDIESKSNIEVGEVADLNGDDRSYCCPECKEEVCTTYDEAEKFLRGE